MQPKLIAILTEFDLTTDISSPVLVSFDKATPVPWPAGVDRSRTDGIIEYDGQPYMWSHRLSKEKQISDYRWIHGNMFRLAIGWNCITDGTHDPRSLTTRERADKAARSTVTLNRALFGTTLRAELVPQHGLNVGTAVATLDGANHTRAEATRLHLAGQALPWDWEKEEDKPEPDPDDLVKIEISDDTSTVEMIVLHLTTESRTMPILRGSEILKFSIDGEEQPPPGGGDMNAVYRWIGGNRYKPAQFQWLDTVGLHRRQRQTYKQTAPPPDQPQQRFRLDSWAGYHRRRHGIY